MKETKNSDEKPVGKSTKKPKEKGKTTVGDIVTGDILQSRRLRKIYPVALWIIVLIFVYIGIHFNYQRLQRLEIRKRIELNEQRSRAVIFSSMRMNASRHSKVVEEVRRRGLPLEESNVPPKVVEREN